MNEAENKTWTILMADDNRHVNNVVKETLSEYGFNVIQAFDGRQAYRAFEEARPDLIFLDYLMPEIDGLDVLRMIKQKDPNSFVVFITGEGSEDIAVQAVPLAEALAMAERGEILDAKTLMGLLILERGGLLQEGAPTQGSRP